jgi:hypothetical protein
MLPAVLPGFAGQWPCAAEKHSGSDLIYSPVVLFSVVFIRSLRLVFASYLYPNKRSSPCGNEQTKEVNNHYTKLQTHQTNVAKHNQASAEMASFLAITGWRKQELLTPQ